MQPLEVLDYAASVDAGINYEVRVPRLYDRDAKVYQFASTLEIECRSTWPEDKADVPYTFTIRGHEPKRDEFNMALDDCHVIDERGSRKFSKVRGKLKPVYQVPSGIGLIEKVRGENHWTGFAWVAPRCLSDMQTLLVGIRPLFVFVHELHKDRVRWISSFTLQTNDPAED